MPDIKYETTVETHLDTGEIQLQVDVVGVDSLRERVHTSIIQTQEQRTRDALITLGWTPPSREATTSAALAMTDKVRAALAELVECKELKARWSFESGAGLTWKSFEAKAEYERRQPLAWKAAREALKL